MLKTKFIYLVIWNIAWFIFAVDQITITHYLFQQKNNIYGDKIVVEDNGVKFLREKKDTQDSSIQSKDHKCTDDELWRDSFNYSFDFDTSQLTIEFKKSQPEQ